MPERRPARIVGRAGERLVLTRQDHIVLLESGAIDDGDWVAAFLQRFDASESGHDHRWVCGVSDRRTALVDARAAYQEARRASELAMTREREGRVQRWAAMGPFRLLVAIPEQTWADARDPRIRPLLDPANRQLAMTVERYLDLAGDVGVTAHDLGIHRGTVYYRLSRVEALTGTSLTDGLDRLALHMALKLEGLRAERGDGSSTSDG